MDPTFLRKEARRGPEKQTVLYLGKIQTLEQRIFILQGKWNSYPLSLIVEKLYLQKNIRSDFLT